MGGWVEFWELCLGEVRLPSFSRKGANSAAHNLHAAQSLRRTCSAQRLPCPAPPHPPSNVCPA